MDIDSIFSSLIIEKGYKKKKTIIVDKVVMNSKEVEENILFIAIRGGNAYVEEALKKGAFVIYDDEKIDLYENENVFLVEDSVKFMQELAHSWRKVLNTKIIGITGSNGKTTVKDMIFQILSTKYKVKKTEGNYNNHIGLPFTLLRSDLNDDYMILEMGMSDFGEIDLLAKISEPNIGIITNIGDSHLEFLKTRENVFIAKTELLPYLKDFLVINNDDQYLNNINNSLNDKSYKVYSINKVDDYIDTELKSILNITNNNKYMYKLEKINHEGSQFIFYYYTNPKNMEINDNKILKKMNIKTNIIGEHNISNLCLAITCALNLDVSEQQILESVSNIKLTDMRFQKLEVNDVIYINDAYNASPISMEKSIKTFSEIYNDNTYKIIVLGDMLELGENENKFHEDVKDYLIDANYNSIFLFGKRMKYLYEELTNNVEKSNEIQHFDSKEEIKKEILKLKKEAKSREERVVVLLKGSRGMKLEEVIEKGL